MNRMPVELVRIILLKLPIYDLMSARMVSKLWHSIVESFKIDGLVVTANTKKPIGEKWYISNDQVKCDYSIRNTNLDTVGLRDPFFASFKSLYIYSSSNIEYFESFDLGQCLNNFKELERLNISYLRLKTESQLTLPSLKYFSLNEIKGNKLILNTPELEGIKIRNPSSLEYFEICYPKKIRFFESYGFNSCILKFTNLEQLYCKRITDVSSKFVNGFPKLKLILFDYCSYILGDLNKQKRRFRRHDLEIYYLGVKSNGSIVNPNPNFYNSFYLFEKNIRTFVDYHFITADRLPFIFFINYTLLDENFEKIPTGFGRKFVNVFEISANKKVANVEKFLNFLAECSIVTNLKLNYRSSDCYSNLLNKVCPHVQQLECDEPLSLKLISSLFFKFHHLFQISFVENGEKFHFRLENNLLELTMNDRQDNNDTILIV